MPKILPCFLLRKVLILVSALASSVWAETAKTSDNRFDPRHFGAQPDGVTLCTEAIQKAIDSCAAAGGGTVRLAGGRFLSGTVHLRSHVTLEVAAGATLLGSTNIAHYPAIRPGLRSYTDNYVDKSLIAGENLENIGLIGRGVIDGQGSGFKWARRMPPFEKDRPFLIRLVNCRGVFVEGLRLRDSAMWMQLYLGCERLTVRDIHVWSYYNQCNDGMDLDGCKDCIVSGCVIESDDDGIVLKSTFERPCENIIISDCIVRSHCSAIKTGTESNGGFKNITIANCVLTSPPRDIKVVNGASRGLSGITLGVADGGQLERVAIANITIQGFTTPLFLRLGDRARPFRPDLPPPPIGSFKNIVIANIVATDVGKIGCSITGQAGHSIENVLLSNLAFTFEGGGARELVAKQVPELPKYYPDCMMFGELPAYGFYCRHVKGLRFSNIQLRTTAADLRHAMAFDDVEDMAIDGLDAAAWPGGAATINLVGTRGAVIRGFQSRTTAGAFLKIAGADSRNITLAGNEITTPGGMIEVSPEVPKDALQIK